MGLLVRRRLPEWKDEDFKCKLKVIERENFDNLDDVVEHFQGYDAFLCTLGSRVKTGEANFVKVDFQYPLNFAQLALDCGVKYYGLLSSMGSSPNSWFLYMKTKGRIE